jgi:cell division protein FtsQ
LQQIGTKAIMATATVVDPSRLPVPARNKARSLIISSRHMWVLHKRIWIRAAAAVTVLVGAVGLYEARDAIGNGFGTLGELAQGEFAHAGFGIAAIEITGQTLTADQDIVQALALEPKSSTLNFDPDAARARIEALPAISSATVRKIFPDHIDVAVTERIPVARWRVDGVTFVVDGEGEQIGEDHGSYGELPLVIGDGAADDALPMIKALDQFPTLKFDLVALSRIGDRRWDMIYETGLRVQLPEAGVGQALKQLDILQSRYALLDRDVTLIDLRVPGLVALAPSADAVKQIADAAKAKTKHTTQHAVDSAYETPTEQHATGAQ